MYQNSIIISTGIYHPKNKVYNDFFVEHFKEQGVEVDGLLEHLGRRKRYFAEEGETSLSMAYEASKAAMEKINMSPDDLDMIVFVSDTPEYTAPSNALKLNHLLGTPNAHVVFDMNSNCVGMLTAFDVVSRYIESKTRIKKVLLVGSLLISSVVSDKDSVTYPTFGDCAAAIIIDNVEEEKKRGFIDSTYFTDSSYHESIVMPKCGYSNLKKEGIDEEDKKWSWTPFDFSFLAGNWTELITRLITRNGLDSNNIDHYIFSQFSDTANIETLEKLGVREGKYTFVGKEYGYTGVTSPFVALNRMWDWVAKEGDYVVFCSVAAGYTTTSLLYLF